MSRGSVLKPRFGSELANPTFLPEWRVTGIALPGDRECWQGMGHPVTSPTAAADPAQPLAALL